MNTIDLGTLNGEVILFGGPYSNLQALEALAGVARTHRIPPGNMIGTGDVAAYCADAEACVALIGTLGINVVAGNCERQLAGGADACDCGFDDDSACSALARSWYAHASRTLSRGSLDWMAACPDRIVFRHNGKRYGVVHGAASAVNRFFWPNAADESLATEITHFERRSGPVDVVVCGHSGLAFRRVVGGKTWLNAGTIGMPENDGDRRTRYVLLSGEGIPIRRLDYDHHAASRAMTD
ncbi:MAG: metallophosphoesterase family protein, partial [Paracoccaceae bacterium]